MSPPTRISGFVINKKISRDHDCIVTIFSREHGKIYAIAPGASRVNSRRNGHMDTATLSEFELQEQDENRMPRIRSCVNLNPYKTIKKYLPSSALVLSIFSDINKSLPLQMSIPGVFPLLKSLLDWLEGKSHITKNESDYIRLVFEIKHETLMGHMPRFEEHICDMEHSAENFTVNLDPIRFSCEGCHSNSKEPLHLSCPALHALLFIQKDTFRNNMSSLPTDLIIRELLLFFSHAREVFAV